VPTTEFPERARRGDTNGHMVVQDMLYFLRDAFDSFIAKVARGQATIPNTATSVVAALGTTMATYSVAITPLSDPGGRVWVSNKTSTQFQINSSVAAPLAGIVFDWVAKGA
jgi:hypothetical protein